MNYEIKGDFVIFFEDINGEVTIVKQVSIDDIMEGYIEQNEEDWRDPKGRAL